MPHHPAPPPSPRPTRPRLVTPRAQRLAIPLVTVLAMAAGPGVAPATTSPNEDGIDRPAVRILPPLGPVEGRQRFEVLIIDRAVARLEASLDGEVVDVRKRPPWTLDLKLASPPREQVLAVEAFDDRGGRLGAHALTINRLDPPFRIRIAQLTPSADGREIRIEATVSVPRKAQLRHVRFFRNDVALTTVEAPPFVARAPVGTDVANAFVRAEAVLEDGRTLEDVELLAARGVTDELEVNLVQVQTLVTTRNGMPVRDLQAGDFEVRERGQAREVHRVYSAGDLALVLGLVVDASGSMAPVWASATDAARDFFAQSLGTRDRAFVIDFDTQLRLTQALTPDRAALDTALDAVEPEGGTALFDAILYGLLQYADEPGRRALVVITDGLDYGSTADPDRTIDIARRLGVPVYVVALPQDGGVAGGEATNVVHSLKLLTDPSGGRLLRLRGRGGLERAFGQIAAELRSQYVVTYYTETPPEEAARRVDIRIKDRKELDVRAVLPLDLVSPGDGDQSPSQSKK